MIVHISHVYHIVAINTDARRVAKFWPWLGGKLTNVKPGINKDSQDDVQRTLHEIVIYVAEAILSQEALLPAFHNTFTKFVQEFSSGADLELGEAEAHELVTAGWILGNLNSTQQHHLSCCCKRNMVHCYIGVMVTFWPPCPSLTITLSAQNKPINKVSNNLMRMQQYLHINWRCSKRSEWQNLQADTCILSIRYAWAIQIWWGRHIKHRSKSMEFYEANDQECL